jgi:copper resistance protein D
MIPTPDPGTPALRGVLVAALMLLVGAPPTLRFVVFPELERRGLDTTRMHRAALTLVGASLVGAVVAATALAVEGGTSADVGSLGAWAGSTAEGQAWAASVVAASVVGAMTVARRAVPARVSRDLWLEAAFVGALGMLLAFCSTRYSAAIGSPAVAILAKFGHMTGAALWAGGLAVLAMLPALVSRGSDEETARFLLSATRRFSMIAVAGVTVAFATGTVIAAWHVPTLGALVATPYGILLSLKVVLVSIAAALGGFNRFVLHERIAYSVRESDGAAALPGMLTVVGPRIEPSAAVSTFARSIRLELAVLVLAIGLSVAITTAVAPYELVEPVAVASNGIVGAVAFVGFAKLLKLGAVGVALCGSLTLGYELGKFGSSE